MADVMRDAWVAWLRGLTAERPVVMTIEDLQWADPASIQLLDAALAELSDRPLLVVGTARPEVATTMPDLFRKRSRHEIHLGPLPPRAARSFVENALGAEVEPGVVDAILERAGGHPFFLEELVRAVSSGQGPELLPTSILGMVQARLDALGQDQRRVLRAASVFGATFTADAVAALLGESMTVGTVSAHLRALADQEIVQRRARPLGEVEHSFRHGLFCDAAYSMLTDGDRALAHRLAAEWLEARGEPDAALVAEHYDRGGAPNRALSHFRRAAKVALARSDLDRAETLAERALGCGPDEDTRGALFAIQSEVSYWRGDLDAASGRASSASVLLVRGSPAWFEAASAAVGALGQRGENDEVASWLAKIAKAESSREARGAHVIALCRAISQLSWAHHAHLGEARARLEAIAEPLDELNPLEAGWVHRVRAEAAWVFDRHVDRCLRAFEASTESFERAHALRFLCLVRMNHASLRGWSGDVAGALELATVARRDAEKMRWSFLTDYGLAVTGMIEAFAGARESEATLERAVVSLRASPRLSFISHVLLGWMAVDRGELDVAERHAEAAARTPVVTELQMGGGALRARISARRGELDRALVEARQATRTEHASRDLELFEGLADAVLAEVYERKGEPDAARLASKNGYERLAAIGRTIPDAGHRARFAVRGIAVDRLFSDAKRYGWVAA